MRIDKFIWMVRLAKTRSLASKLCNDGKVVVNDDVCKASKLIQSNDRISVKFHPIWRDFKIIDIPKSRIGAKLVADHLIETTEAATLAHYEEIIQANRQNKQLGFKGRPTKKNRRDLDKMK